MVSDPGFTPRKLSLTHSTAPGSLWYYAPNKGAPIAFAVFFAISGSIHVWQCFKYKCWKVGGLLPWAAAVFVSGFVLREVGAFNYSNLNIFISSTVLLLVAPPVYEGANYFLLGRILYYVPYHSPLHPGRVVTTFIGIDAVIGALTGNGAANVSNSSLPQSKVTMGKNLLKAALILQLASMAGFVAIAARYQYKCRQTGVLSPNLRTVLITLYTSCALISIRTIYRTVEYFMVASLNANTNFKKISPIIKHEAFFWVFEATLMLLNSVLMNTFHPSRFLPRNNKIYLSEDGVTEIEGPGYDDKRPFLVTLFDPFDIAGLITRRDKKNRYWENGTSTAAAATATQEPQNEKVSANTVSNGAV
ncbi:hypothetical protein GP486_003095 [Trichoglossum hirsutum]|uniref:RTA1 domain protein n=1 Tax=Trichoglossum hirsutum TaxID=265104 RepID=A0A9P8LDQ4_9PEZI|nr:hypothetical protein GP486_003095 [Trichoglossum hirsutum]